MFFTSGTSKVRPTRDACPHQCQMLKWSLQRSLLSWCDSNLSRVTRSLPRLGNRFCQRHIIRNISSPARSWSKGSVAWNHVLKQTRKSHSRRALRFGFHQGEWTWSRSLQRIRDLHSIEQRLWILILRVLCRCWCRKWRKSRSLLD